MEKELLVIQNQLNETNKHLRAIRTWVAIAGIIFIAIPLAIIVLFMIGIATIPF